MISEVVIIPYRGFIYFLSLNYYFFLLGLVPYGLGCPIKFIRIVEIKMLLTFYGFDLI